MILRNPQNPSASQPTHSTTGCHYISHPKLGNRVQEQFTESTGFSALKTPLSSRTAERANLPSTNGAPADRTRNSLPAIGNGMEYNSGGTGRRSYRGEYGTASAEGAADAPRADSTYMSQHGEQGHFDKGDDHNREEGYTYNSVVDGAKERAERHQTSFVRSRMRGNGGGISGARGAVSRSNEVLAGMAAVQTEVPPVSMASAGYDSDDTGEGAGTRTGDEGRPGHDGREVAQGFLKIAEEGQGQGQNTIWSETKTKAGKDRKRLPLACIACRRKKIRCSGEKPTCRHCGRSRTPCVYKQSARKTTPRTDYMAMLDRRLKRMEERLIRNVPKEEIGAVLSTTGRSVVRPSLSTISAKFGLSGKKRSASTAFGEEIDLWAKGDGTAELKSMAGSEGWGDASIGKMGQVDTDDGSHALPPKDIQEHLAEVFFDYVYGQPYFLLHKPSFMRRLRSGTAPPVLVLAVCAVSARFSKHHAVRHDPPFLAGESFATEALRQLLKNFDVPNITNVTVCAMLSLHALGTCHGGRSWVLGGMATRMAHAVALHKEVNNDPLGRLPPGSAVDTLHQDEGGNMSFVDREICRRTMWACFVMDRFTASGTERPHLIAESELEIQLPVRERNLELDMPAITERLDGTVKDFEGESGDPGDNMGVAAYMVKIVALYGRAVKYVNQGGRERDPYKIWEAQSQFTSLSKEAKKFAETLPKSLQYTPENIEIHASERLIGQFMFVHIALHQVRLFLHQTALPTKGHNPPGGFENATTEVALSSATMISRILLDIEERGAIVVAPFMGYCACSASRFHMKRVFASKKNIQEEAKCNMEVCLRFLHRVRNYWGLFYRLIDDLKWLYIKYSDSVEQGLPLSDEHQLQYGDWFNKYPKGVTASDYQGDNTLRSQNPNNNPSLDPVLSQKSNLRTADEFFSGLGPRQQAQPLPVAVPPVPPPKIQTQPYVHTSPPLHSHTPSAVHPGTSPSSVHHSQSPAFRHSQSPTLHHSPATHHSPGMSAPPAIAPTPTAAPGRSELEGKLDPQLLSPHAPHALSAPQQAGIYPANYQQQGQNPQHQASVPTLLPEVPHQVSYPNYSVTLSRTSASVDPVHAGMHHHHHHQGHHQHSQGQDYLYDLYSSGSDPVYLGAVASLTDGIWADVNTFQDQTSSAWFMPFNSCPSGFETGIGEMGDVNMMNGGGTPAGGGGGEDGGGGRGRGGGGGGGDVGNGGGIPRLVSESGRGGASGATAYDHTVR